MTRLRARHRPRSRPGPDGTGGRWWRLPATAAAALCLLALPAAADAQWALDRGEGWTQLTVFRHETSEEFKRDGEVRDFANAGHSVTTSFFLTSALGVADGLDVWAQVPLQGLSFEDAGSDLSKTAVGDVKVWARVGPRLISEAAARALPFSIAVQAGAKLPVSDFPVDSEIIPVTDGQRDYEVMGQVGKSLHPLPLYAKAWLGFRWRERNDEVLTDFGDELFGLAEVGGRAGPVPWRVTVNALWGDPHVKEGIELESSARKIVEILPVIAVPTGPGGLRLEFGGRFPVDGRNLPAGPALRAGFFLPWSLN